MLNVKNCDKQCPFILNACGCASRHFSDNNFPSLCCSHMEKKNVLEGLFAYLLKIEKNLEYVQIFLAWHDSLAIDSAVTICR